MKTTNQHPNKTKRRCLWLMGLLTLCLSLSLTACTHVWDGLFDKEGDTPLDTDLLVIPGVNDEEDTMIAFDNPVNYTGEVHEGTEICYVGNGARRGRVIVIDPGHQAEGSDVQESIGPGSDVTKDEVTWGATGVHVGEEHELNLKVALLLRDRLIERGYSVVMIRETADVNISNKARAEIANKYNAAAYIRIHANAYDDPEMNGALTICQTPNNPFPTCAAHYEVSHLLSERVLTAYCNATGMEKLGVREYDTYTGTNWSKVPTTIIEMGFLTNQSDDMVMATTFFQQKAAEGIANGIDTFIDIIEVREENQNGGTSDTQAVKEDTVPPMESEGGSPETIVTEAMTDIITEPVTEGATEPLTEDVTSAPANDTPTEDVIFENPVEYTGDAHAGTEICYLGSGENKAQVIVIDPGHQAEGSSEQEPIGPESTETKNEVTWGATGAYTAQKEHELNLKVALLLRDQLIERGYSVVMIRETADVNISNMERAEIANKYNAAAYIRIHANAYDDLDMNGAMTICQSANNPFPTCAAHYAVSRQLSESVLTAYCTATEMKDLGVREYDTYTGTNWSKVPTTIIEMGFLTNQADDTTMATEAFQQKAAEGIANGIDAFLQESQA